MNFAMVLDDSRGANPNVLRFSDMSSLPLDGKLLGNQNRPHNKHFTLELHSSFQYQDSGTVTFVGEEDFWLFLNGHRVIELDGVHRSLRSDVSLDNLTSTMGLEMGEVYDFDLFYAERHTEEASFLLISSLYFVPNSAG